MCVCVCVHVCMCVRVCVCVCVFGAPVVERGGSSTDAHLLQKVLVADGTCIFLLSGGLRVTSSPFHAR